MVNERRRLFILIGLMAFLAVSVTAVSTFVMYNAYFDQQKSRLLELAKSQARVIEAIARFEQNQKSSNQAQAPFHDALAQIRDAHKQLVGFGETGEFVLAYRKGERILWLTESRHEAGSVPVSTSFDVLSATPMRRALEGKSGSLQGLDNRGEPVLSAYEPVALLNLGIVAKINMSEIRSPFIQAGILFSLIGIFLVLLMGMVFYRIGNPLVSHLQRALKDLKQSHDAQESIIEERTAELRSELTMRELIEDSLVEAKIQADSANHTKSQFLANMSHELRTPLNSIIGFSEILKHEMFGPLNNEKYQSYATDINNSGTHLLTLINEILDVSKIEAGAFTLDEDIFDPNQPLQESLRMVEDRAKRAGLQMTCEVPNDLPCLMADQLRVKQMMLNLLTNSIKFTPKGGSVHISMHGHLDAGLEIVVADTGIGIAENDIEQVQLPFGQAIRDPMINHEDGTGLGLPLIKMLIELHGGTMKLTSQVGQGTQVVLRFPKERVSEPVRQLRAS